MSKFAKRNESVDMDVGRILSCKLSGSDSKNFRAAA